MSPPLGRIAVGAAATVVLAPTLLIGALLVVETEPRDGPAHQIIDTIEDQIGHSDELHYYAHEVLGKVLSLCPCSAGLSREQYRKAAMHRRGS